MGIKYADLVSMSDEELIEESDHKLGRNQVQPPAEIFLGELHRRTMRRHTKVITWLTAVITVLTAVNVGIVAGWW